MGCKCNVRNLTFSQTSLILCMHVYIWNGCKDNEKIDFFWFKQFSYVTTTTIFALYNRSHFSSIEIIYYIHNGNNSMVATKDIYACSFSLISNTRMWMCKQIKQIIWMFTLSTPSTNIMFFVFKQIHFQHFS